MPRNRSTPLLGRALKSLFFPLPSSGKPESKKRDLKDSAATPEIEPPKDPQCHELAQLLNSAADKVRVDTCHLPEAADKDYLFADLEFETCTLTVAFSRDLVEAFLAGFSFLEDFEQEDLFALLESHNLSCWDFEPIEKAVNALIESGQKTCWREIAMGSSPEPIRGQKPRTEFAAEEASAELEPYFGLLADAKATEYPDGMRACWVEPGQPLAALEPPSEGTPGQDVFGYEIAPPVDEESSFVAGSGVEASPPTVLNSGRSNTATSISWKARSESAIRSVLIATVPRVTSSMFPQHWAVRTRRASKVCSSARGFVEESTARRSRNWPRSQGMVPPNLTDFSLPRAEHRGTGAAARSVSGSQEIEPPPRSIRMARSTARKPTRC